MPRHFVTPRHLRGLAQFRGSNSAGLALGASPPLKFGPGKNELWRLPLKSGHSSPCIAGHAIFLTTYDQKYQILALLCIERTTGQILWKREVATPAIETGHPSFNPASSTPTSDGTRVVAYFGSFGLICFDMRGNPLWEVRLPLTKSYAGNATSPAIVGDKVILYRGNYVDHFLIAVDKTSGKELWKVPQKEPFSGELACTACPIVAGNKLIVHSARALQALDLSSGRQIWVAKCATTATSTPVLAGEEVIVAAWNKMGEPALRPPFPDFAQLLVDRDKDGDQRISPDEFPELWIFHRPEGAEAPQNGATVRFRSVDKNNNFQIEREEWALRVQDLKAFRGSYDSHGMLAVRLDSQGLIPAESIRTLATQGIPEVPSPLVNANHLYFVKNGGVLTCLDLRTGKRLYRTRTKGRGTHYASPLIVDGKIFTTSGDGRISILTLGPDPKILATNDLHDAVFATPAIVNGTFYVRTHSALFAFGRKQEIVKE